MDRIGALTDVDPVDKFFAFAVSRFTALAASSLRAWLHGTLCLGQWASWHSLLQ